MAQTSGLNVGPKRTAFVDVSNTSRALVDIGQKNQVKDRVAILNNREGPIADKENIPFSGASEAFLRPAQRPSNHTSKQILTTSSFSNAAFLPTKSSTTTNNSSTNNPSTFAESRLPPIIKSGVSKKATVIFNDQSDPKLGAQLEVAVSAHQVVDMDSQSVKNPRHYKSQPQLRKEQPVVLRRTQSRHFGNYEELDNYDDNATEASYEDALEDLPEQVEQSPQTTEALESSNTPESEDKHVASAVPSATGSDELLPPPVAYELEEYWDEDDEEYFEEQGYTTAHSYRSHGDNTTGGATTVVAPKVTAKIQQELEIAKVIVQNSRTEDEIEEEAWDVSMVAEYGEEIFQYMKALEVRPLTLDSCPPRLPIVAFPFTYPFPWALINAHSHAFLVFLVFPVCFFLSFTPFSHRFSSTPIPQHHPLPLHTLFQSHQ